MALDDLSNCPLKDTSRWFLRRRALWGWLLRIDPDDHVDGTNNATLLAARVAPSSGGHHSAAWYDFGAVMVDAAPEITNMRLVVAGKIEYEGAIRFVS
ncbi:hypothetical protein B0H19DRAFT_1254169 [Mycena capillaripes]|nr:hypothetical protein B0H19DRAFT_1254169 [Mycena capillaripes]